MLLMLLLKTIKTATMRGRTRVMPGLAEATETEGGGREKDVCAGMAVQVRAESVES
jgi:hypothetical protein